jgi:hypothetical protein
VRGVILNTKKESLLFERLATYKKSKLNAIDISIIGRI